MAARHYNLDEVTLSIAGVVVTEFATGDAIEIEFDEDDWNVTQGHHGSVVRSKMPNNIASITVTVMQGSPVNELLQSLSDQDRFTGFGAGPFFVKDLNGTSLATAPSSWIKKVPNMTMGTEPGEREWQVTAANLEMHHGQNRLT